MLLHVSRWASHSFLSRHCSSAYNRVSVFPVDQADSEKGPCFPNVACKSSALHCTSYMCRVWHVSRRLPYRTVLHTQMQLIIVQIKILIFSFSPTIIVATFKVIEPNYNPVQQEYDLLQQEKYWHKNRSVIKISIISLFSANSCMWQF